MSNHHDNHHSDEKKPISFTVPFILASVTITIILMLVSIGDPCHCKESCEAEGHETHAVEGGHEATKATKASETAVETQEAVTPVDTASAKKEEAHH